MCKQALPIFGNTYARSSIISLCHCVVQRFDCSLACRDNERCHETVATRVDSAGWLCPAASRGEGRTAASVAEASPSSVLGNPSLTSCASVSVADHVKASMSAQDWTMVMLGGEAQQFLLLLLLLLQLQPWSAELTPIVAGNVPGWVMWVTRAVGVYVMGVMVDW